MSVCIALFTPIEIIVVELSVSERQITGRKENMYLTTKSGRKVYLNTEKEDAEIQKGIDADPDTFEVEDFSILKKAGRPVSNKTKDCVS